MLARCSRLSLFHRFHGFSDGVAHTRPLASRADSSTVGCWSGERCVGFGTLAGPAGNVHVGVLVEDTWQQIGVGKRIFSALVDTARAALVDELHADVLGEDGFVLPLLAQAGRLHVNLDVGGVFGAGRRPAPFSIPVRGRRGRCMNSVPRRDAGQLFGIELPIVLGPMAGGPSTPRLAAAVSNAGGLGSLGEGYRTPAEIRADIRAVRSLTDRPFAVNLFAPEPVDVDAGSVRRAIEALAPYRRELGLPPQAPPNGSPRTSASSWRPSSRRKLPSSPPPSGSYRTGPWMRCTGRARWWVATATTPAEARAITGNGADFVVAQGAEAGGHRGSFLASGKGEDLIGLVALVPAVLDVADVPVVAAGGMADGRGIAAALVLGASAAQLGTAFPALSGSRHEPRLSPRGRIGLPGGHRDHAGVLRPPGPGYRQPARRRPRRPHGPAALSRPQRPHTGVAGDGCSPGRFERSVAVGRTGGRSAESGARR